MSHLRDVQELLYGLITTPMGVPKRKDGIIFRDAVLPIRGDQRLGTTERISIYANAYYHRLLDCLTEEFPATLAAVGSHRFADLVRDYLVSRAPSEPSIFHLGEKFSDFLRTYRLTEYCPFTVDLARLERSTFDVFLGEHPPPIHGLCAGPPSSAVEEGHAMAQTILSHQTGSDADETTRGRHAMVPEGQPTR